ncbi:rhomboid family intramembrane serine protease [Vulgatibacter incomptus]|uniref:Rhomboid family serine protease n=1 Tax=Vulgatibacter incomptus TaxID=1391653 RepID=A0A0K1PCT1_9BACT|nr:rhomboid family intramembrane serine protease [Vulgatibacter incomptus]AKU91348.1 rhomboid family serine protease [Vulgatibacter incomptus]
MLPLKDDLPVRRFPLVTIALVAANVAVFAWQIAKAPSFVDSIRFLGMVPGAFAPADSAPVGLPPVLTIFTSMFAHGSLLHLGGNLLFLWIFGNNVEDAMGRLGFLGFYVLCGIGAAAAQVGFDPASQIPMVGASGAIAGVLGAYFLLYPRARVLTVIPIFVFLKFIWVPAIFFLGIWFVFQLLGGLGTPEGAGGVAFWAHVGGFVAGLLLVKPFAGTIWRRPQARKPSLF